MSQIGWRRAQQERLAARASHKKREKHMSMFSAPSAPSGGIKLDDHKGALLLVEPVSFESGINTSFGLADAVKVTINVIEGAGAGESYTDALLFPKLLVSQLKGEIGNKVLGRLGQGTAKPGQSAPWILQEASGDDIAKAESWVTENAKQTVTSATAPF